MITPTQQKRAAETVMPSQADHSHKPLQWTDETVHRYWKWLARFPEQYFTYQFGDIIVFRLRPWLEGRQTVLDYGCGTGHLVRHLAALGGRVTASDFSPSAVAATIERNGDIPGFDGAFAVDQLVAGTRKYDAIVSVEVIEHLSDTHLDSFFSSLSVLLAQDGIVVLTTPNDEDLELSQVYCPQCDQAFHRWQHVRSWSETTLTSEMERRGFEVIHTLTCDFSHNWQRQPLEALKRFVKAILGRPHRQPHLACIARLRRAVST
jgi:2-polyprenyl-3-methyl-5-hydroxy-6-metoxy-1,4-benzoquinol methylase